MNRVDPTFNYFGEKGIVVGPQIQLVKDPALNQVLERKKRKLEKPSGEHGFFGIKEMIIHFFHSHHNFFPSNYGPVRNEQGER